MTVKSHMVVGGFACLLAALGAPATAKAQTRATITGIVADGTGAILPHAALTLSSPDLVGGTQATTSSAEGQYRFSELVPGTYQVTATLQGCRTVQRISVPSRCWSRRLPVGDASGEGGGPSRILRTAKPNLRAAATV